jgi:hypothetical protein
MTRPGTGAGSGTRELFQLGVEGGEFVRHLGVAHGFDPLLGKPDASIAPFEACISSADNTTSSSQPSGVVPAGVVPVGVVPVGVVIVTGSRRARSAKPRKPCCSSASVIRTISMQTP